MNAITQIRKLSIWIFLIPLLAINVCLFISQNPSFLENTIFQVDQIGRSGFSIPYLDGSLSISRASRTYPQYLIFKPAMITTSIILYYYWSYNNKLVNNFKSTNINYKFKHITDILFNNLNINKSDIILDVGCGSGFTTKICADKVGSEGKIVGVDLSLPLINLLQRKYNKCKKSKKSYWCLKDA